MAITLLELVQTTVEELATDIASPAAVTSSTDRSVKQLFRLANRVGSDLVREFEWRRLVTEYTFATVNGTADYDLPSDFDRMVSDTHYDRSNFWMNSGPKSSQAWQWLNAGITTLGPQFRWRMYQNKVRFYTTPTAAYTMAYEYVSRNWVIADGDTTPSKSLFSEDDDTCIYPDDVMLLGLRYRWLSAKGLDFEPALVEFRNAVATAKSQDTPAGRESLAPTLRPIFITQDSVAEANWSL